MNLGQVQQQDDKNFLPQLEYSTKEAKKGIFAVQQFISIGQVSSEIPLHFPALVL